ncbi:hypothetical protein EDB81DRAFT_841869 [Dactylonectria macrodidyma]|uniref:Uncharacterized protein n=1 Tax=Dactylonectria macrodidyma TaxID=307937 RepID=A0A9P9EZ48_9HYPO|nr:hypothetical protein EDB81DRAFT_841869 [Dactylonectria macrodidyma]
MDKLQPAPPSQITNDVNGKVAIVTGGAQGLGEAIVRFLAHHGAKVIIADINETAARKVERELASNVSFVKCDVTQWTHNVELFHQTCEKFGKIDIVVLNAVEDPEVIFANDPASTLVQEAQMQVQYNYLANEREGRSEDSPLKPPTTKIFDVNITGYMYGMKLAVHYLAKNPGGRIIVLGSSTSYMAIPIEPLYVASKHAELGLARATSQMAEVRDNGISIGFVAPFLVRSPLTQYVVDLEFVRKNCPLSELEDVTNAVGILLTTPIEKANGMSVAILGQTLTEMEEPVTQYVQSLLF